MLNRQAAPSGGGNRQGGAIPKLVNEMLSPTPREFQIRSVKQLDGQFGPQLSIKGSLEGETVMWYLKLGGRNPNPNVDPLFDQFGEDENNWAGKYFYLHLEQDTHTENWYPRVTFKPLGSRVSQATPKEATTKK